MFTPSSTPPPAKITPPMTYKTAERRRWVAFSVRAEAETVSSPGGLLNDRSAGSNGVGFRDDACSVASRSSASCIGGAGAKVGGSHTTRSVAAASVMLWKRCARSRDMQRANHSSNPRGTDAMLDGFGMGSLQMAMTSPPSVEALNGRVAVKHSKAITPNDQMSDR